MSEQHEAFDYIARGWRVFPVKGATGRSRADYKRPALGIRWSDDSTTDPHQVAAWFSGSGNLGVAVDLGPSNLLVIDIDHPDKLDPNLKPLLEGGWRLQGNRERISYMFTVPEGRKVRQARHPWGEVKAAGGYVVLPNSPHPSGVDYQWIEQPGSAPPPASDALITAIEPKPRNAPKGKAWDGAPATDAEQQWCRELMARQVARLAGAKTGGRNHALNNAALILGHYVPHILAQDEVRAKLIEAARANGLEKDDGARAVTGTIDSGLFTGMGQPQRPVVGRSQARASIIELAMEHFQMYRTREGLAFLVPNDGPQIALTKDRARQQLAGLMYQQTGTVPGRSALDDAWPIIEMHCERQIDLPLRAGMHEGRIILDLGTTTGEAVVIGDGRVEVVPQSPIPFRRSRVTLPLPLPSATPDWSGLWKVLNVDEDDRDVVKNFLRAALLPNTPHPILQTGGEMGSAKSTASRIIASVFDPGDVLRPPKDGAGWVAHLTARWILPMDNISRIDNWWSDLLCQTATGGVDIGRQLYTDADVVARQMRGAVILNGISMSNALRSDLAERLLPIELRRPKEYRTETDIYGEFARHHPHILAALLNDIAQLLPVIGEVEFNRELRMADFVQMVAAADKVLGEAGMARYADIHADAGALALDSDAVAQAVLAFMAEPTRTEPWDASASALLDELAKRRHGDDWWSRVDYWPKNPQALSVAIKRSAPLLKTMGLSATFIKGGKGRRRVRLEWASGDARDAYNHRDDRP